MLFLPECFSFIGRSPAEVLDLCYIDVTCWTILTILDSVKIDLHPAQFLVSSVLLHRQYK